MTDADFTELEPQSFVYKIFLPEQLAVFESRGEFLGSPDDLRDGFIHLSFAKQVQGSLEKHFSGHSDLVIAEFRAADLGEKLLLEASRGGQLFPHLHGPLLKVHQRRTVKMSEWGASK